MNAYTGRKTIISLIMAGMLFTPSGVYANERLVDEIYKEAQDNVLVSGLSVEIAIAMLAEGAEGETKEKLLDYCAKYGIEAEKLPELLKEYKDLRMVKLHLADSIWINEGMDVNEAYRANLADLYLAEANVLNLREEGSADRINTWCSENTEGLIDKLAEQEMLSDIEVILANALYFGGHWMDPFDEPEEADFTNIDGTLTDIDMMYGKADLYLENENASGFMKDYGDNFYFVGILPEKEGEFTLEELKLSELMASASMEYDVAIGLPKFEAEFETSLRDALKELELGMLFDGSADLSGISETGLQVSDILHKTAIRVDEEGTEAAAATEVMIAKSAFPMQKEEKEVILDRPFAYGIYDAANECWIFQGKVITM